MTDEYEKEEDEEYQSEEETSESEDEEYEDEVEDEEASDESEEDEDSVASWGYEEKKSRFSKEMLAGFAAIAVLVTIFGIVVYKKLPGASDSAEVAAGPEASLGNPESSLGNPEGTETPPGEDLNDPFRTGAENGVALSELGPQTEPGSSNGISNASLNGNVFENTSQSNDGSTDFAPDASPSETASLFPDATSNGQETSNDPFRNTDPLGNSEPFASNSETEDLFPGQPDTGLASNSTPPFGSSTVGTTTATDEFGRPLASNELNSGQPGSTTAFPGSGPGELGESTRRDPFGGPDLSVGTGSTSPDSGSPAFNSNEGSSSELFPQDNQLAQNEPSIDSSLNSSLSGATDSALQPSTSGSSSEFGSSTDSTLRNDPFGSNAGSGSSEPSGLFDRTPASSLDAGGVNEPSSTNLSGTTGFGNDTLPGSEFGTPQPSTTGSEFGSLDSGPSTTSSSPFGNEEPFGTSETGSANSNFGAPETASPSTSNDPFPATTDKPSTGFDAGNGFDTGTSEPVNLFPDTNSQPTTTTSNDPFQPPMTSSSNSSLPNSSASAISGGPFGNEAFNTDSSARQSTFAGQPANSGKYTVQDGDSYWNISKKVYGTAKYFQVLADHNRRTIADPQKMKAGVSIETPPASVLQGRLKTVRRTAPPSALAGQIDASGRAERSGSAGSVGSTSSAGESMTVSRRETKPKQPSGILFNQQGYPMFRIGETDTLTSIASDHLGRASRWQQVFNMNRDQLQSPDKLQIGMLLKLPADASRVPLVDRTSSLR